MTTPPREALNAWAWRCLHYGDSLAPDESSLGRLARSGIPFIAGIPILVREPDHYVRSERVYTCILAGFPRQLSFRSNSNDIIDDHHVDLAFRCPAKFAEAAREGGAQRHPQRQVADRPEISDGREGRAD